MSKIEITSLHFSLISNYIKNEKLFSLFIKAKVITSKTKIQSKNIMIKIIIKK